MLMKLAVLLVISCLLGCETQPTAAPNKISKERIFSQQELQVLQTDQPAEAVYDFSLDKEEQFRSIALQVDKDICKGPTYISCDFVFSTEEKINLNMLYANYCPNQTSYGFGLHKMRFIDVLFNRKDQVLVDGDLYGVTELQEAIIAASMSSYHYELRVKISWDYLNTQMKKEYLQNILKGYLRFLSTIALKDYKKDLNQLDSSQLSKLKSKLQFVFVLNGGVLPPPPPPPPIELVPED